MPDLKILVVEDEKILAVILQKSLAKKGYEITQMLSYGEDVLDSISDNRPDIVLMDITLKGEIDGIEATRRINEGPNVPVIYLTAHTDDMTRSRAEQTRHFGYLEKPVDLVELEAAIVAVEARIKQ